MKIILFKGLGQTNNLEKQTESKSMQKMEGLCHRMLAVKGYTENWGEHISIERKSMQEQVFLTIKLISELQLP